MAHSMPVPVSCRSVEGARARLPLRAPGRFPRGLAIAWIGALAIWILTDTPARAGQPAAIVIAAQGVTPEVAADDVLSEGQVFDLAAGAELQLAYYGACVIETIRGGHVVIGSKQSVVTAGQVQRDTVFCSANQPSGTATASDTDVAGLFLRGDMGRRTVDDPQPLLILGGAPDSRPQSVTFVITRLDRSETPIQAVTIGHGIDLRMTPWRLAIGGRYRVEAAGRSAEFDVLPAGTAGWVARLVSF